MSYIGVNPQLKAYKDAMFVAIGGESVIPIKCNMETLVIKNGSFLVPRLDYYINRENTISMSTAASKGDEYYIIDISTFSFSESITRTEVEEMLDKDARPLFEVLWWPSRTSIPSGLVPADGQELSRGLYMDAFTGIEAGLVPLVSDEDWISIPAKRASYTKGDGKTTFRVPDYNGKSEGGSAAVVLRGDGLNADPVGSIQGDAIRNINGSFRTGVRNEDVNASDGAFSYLRDTGKSISVDGGELADTITLDASRVVPTGPENRMVNTAGVWCIRLFNGTVYAGRANAAQLATEVGKLNSEVQRISNELEFGRWYSSATPQFKDRISSTGAWLVRPDEASMKETKYELRIKGIVRIAPGMTASREILRINNPSNGLLVKEYDAVLVGPGDTQGGFLSSYLEKLSTSESEAFLALEINAGSFVSGWCIFDTIILKDPVTTGEAS